jgi:hypothetical protein
VVANEWPRASLTRLGKLPSIDIHMPQAVEAKLLQAWRVGALLQPFRGENKTTEGLKSQDLL